MTTLLADTGPIVALLNPRDQHHAWAIACFRNFKPPLQSCESVFGEVYHLLRDLPESRAVFEDMMEKGVFESAFRFTDAQAETLQLLRKYHDTPMDFADACLVRMSEVRLDCKIWTIDSDFKFYRRNTRQIIPVLAPWS